MKIAGSLFFLLIFCCVLAAQTAMPPAAGIGTKNDPFEIATLANLYWISVDWNRWGYSYVQTANIDASGTKNWSGGQGWIPIGSEVMWFTGTYDGKGHIISGLHVNRPNKQNTGFFGYTDGAEIRNLRLIEVDITGGSYTGGLIGRNMHSLVSNCYVTGIVKGNAFVGGLIGWNYSHKIWRNHSEATVRGIGSSVGRVIGYNF